MKIVIGSDHAGFQLKVAMGDVLRSLGQEVLDVGAFNENPSDYPEFSMFGELPSWGLYLRHVDSITLRNLQLTSTQPDYRPACFFYDVSRIISADLQTN